MTARMSRDLLVSPSVEEQCNTFTDPQSLVQMNPKESVKINNLNFS